MCHMNKPSSAQRRPRLARGAQKHLQGRQILGFGTVWGGPGTTITLKVHLLTFPRVLLRTRIPEFLKVHVLRFPTFCAAHRSPTIIESAFVDMSDVFVLRTGVPEFLKVHILRFATSSSAHRNPRIPESPLFDISDGLFCAQESQGAWKYFFEISDVLLGRRRRRSKRRRSKISNNRKS